MPKTILTTKMIATASFTRSTSADGTIVPEIGAYEACLKDRERAEGDTARKCIKKSLA